MSPADQTALEPSAAAPRVHWMSAAGFGADWIRDPVTEAACGYADEC